MTNFDKKSLINENRRLKQRVEAAQQEINTIKSSRAYGTIRLIGHVKKQVKESPVGFSKKVAKKILTKGGILKGTESARKNLNLQSTLQEQYETWITLNEPDQRTLDDQVKQSNLFSKKPLISIITPVFNPPEDVFIELIESVRAQTYDKFELCLGNFGDDQGIKDIIAEYAKKDPRIKDLQFSENKGIAENSNQILAKAQGDYVVLLDHDDTLSPDALYENVKLLNEDDYDFIYSDKDKIDDKGNRFDPFFKPDWSPEIMLNANYLTHLNLMRTSIVNKVGGWDSKTDGAQDWDVFLKVIAASKKVAHIPKVLYHWRVIATSTAFSIETKPYALAGQRVAVDNYLKKIKVTGKSYHVGAELLIDWENNAVSKPVLFVKSHNSSYLRDFISDIQSDENIGKHVKEIVVFHDYSFDSKPNDIPGIKCTFISYEPSKYFLELVSQASNFKDETILFYDDRIQTNVSSKDIQDLQGWIQIKGVKAVAPRLNRDNDFALDCGAVITTEGIKPLFAGSPPYHQAAMGNVEWVRDMRVLNPYVFITNAVFIAEIDKKLTGEITDDESVHTAIHLALSSKGRLVFNPKVNIRVRTTNNIDVHQYYDEASALLENFTDTTDPYMNPNLSALNPMNLTKIVQSTDADDPEPEQSFGYQNEAMVHALNRRLSMKEFDENLKHIAQSNKIELKNIETALIILPDFQAIYAGLNNIFVFAENMRKKFGTRVTFALMTDDVVLEKQQSLVAEKYPELAESSTFMTVDPYSVSKLPTVDVAICTQWATAYVLALYNKSKRKCYFIQDKEASFYPKGTISALVDNTYTFGFYGLANTEGLLRWYETEFDGNGVVLRSNIDLTSYGPPEKLNIHPKAPYKVFFYARPNEPRNAFEIGVAALTELKKRLGKDLEVYAAGAEWDPSDYGLSDTVINLGKISYAKLPEFYRSMDAGMMLMFSGHPGVVASELMASGTPVVVNVYEDITWHELYQNGQTAVVSKVTADAMADSFMNVLEDPELRERVIVGGLAKVKDFYGHYDESFDTALSTLKKML
jgi:glycosyltransferase involved in cell wall biosynthesis